MSYQFTKDTINEDVLSQDTHWFDRTGKEHLITEMNPRHCLGAMRKLIDRFGQRGQTSAVFHALYKQSMK